MHVHTDVFVVGAGPAGLSAAIEAGRAGLDVIVADENPAPGGQIYRQLPAPFRPTATGRDAGANLIEQSRKAGVTFRFGCTAWGMFEPDVMEVTDDAGAARIRARRTIIATGAYDRAVPVPGWTLPGVFTVGGAQALLKSQRILAGRRVLLSGVGPLLLVVASQLHQAGADIVAVAEPVSAARPLLALPGFARAWGLLAQGIRYRWSLAKGRVPWLSGTALVAVGGSDHVESAVVASVDRRWRPIPSTERRFDVDAVCIGYGLVPSIELPRICGCEAIYEPLARMWIPVRNDDMESSVPGIFIAGDGAGIAGAVVAADEGRLAGLAIARQLGRLAGGDAARRMAPLRRRLRGLHAFRRAMDRTYALQSGMLEWAAADTIVCRCEEATMSDLEAAVQDGADAPGPLKSFTRCGMGPCQGRMCAAATTEWLAARLGTRVEQLGLPPTAPPAKPVVQLAAL